MTTATSTRVTFGLYALVIKQDLTPACEDIQPFSKLNDLKTGNVTSKPLITYEQDYWLLDGNYKFKSEIETAIHVGLMSLSMSDANTEFAIPPVLTMTFSQVHSIDGLTIRFAQTSNDYADNIIVQFYNAADELIQTDYYTPSSWEFSTEQAINDFKKIVITFNSTNKPFRYLRVTGIDFGQLISFTGTDIKSAAVVEEINPLSTELPITILDLELFSTEAEFSIVNPAGYYTALQYRQPISLYENVGNDSIFIGQFYLNTWENSSNEEIKFSCVDILGVLDAIPYLGGIWLNSGIAIEDLLLEMMEAIQMPYELDTALYGTAIIGWIPVCTYREALQQICFAAGAHVNCSRSNILKISKTELVSESAGYDFTITDAEKGKESLSLKVLVTGVEVAAHNFIENSTALELFNKELSVGTHLITFSQPAHDLEITGGTIVSYGANHAIISVASPGTVVLSGQGYTDTTQVHGVYNTEIDTNIANVLAISDATLVNYDNVTALTQRIYDYYQMRYLQKIKLYAPTAIVGGVALVDTLYGQHIRGMVEKMNLDLSGGFVAQTELVGVITR